MRIIWSRQARRDLARVSEFLAPVAPDAAARTFQILVAAPNRLRDYPRIGERVSSPPSREVRRLSVKHYEIKYEIAADAIVVLRVRHAREQAATIDD